MDKLLFLNAQGFSQYFLSSKLNYILTTIHWKIPSKILPQPLTKDHREILNIPIIHPNIQELH